MYDLPVFPLNTVLFPGMPLHLHIFEERYKMMMKDVLEKDKTFGIALIRNGTEALGPVADPYLVGCSAKIIEVDAYPDGRMNLLTLGQDRFQIKEMNRELPYLVCSVDSMPIEQPRTLPVVRGAHLLSHYITQYLQLLAASKISDPDMDESFLGKIHLPEDHDPTMLIYVACGLLQLPSSEKQNLLEIKSAPQLFEQVIRIYKRELSLYPGLMDVSEDSSRRSAWLN